MTVYIIIIAVMLVLSAFFSATETSFNFANRMRLKKSAESGNKISRIAYGITENFTATLSAILIGNNLANIAASSAATLVVMSLLSDIPNGNVWAPVISTAVTTLIVLTFCEIIPKVLAKRFADTSVRWFSIPIKIITFILYPLVFIVTFLITVLRKLWGRDDKDSPTFTDEELSSIIETVEEEGVIDEDKGELLRSTLDFPETTVEEIMTPRIDMTAVDIDDDIASIDAVLREERYSRVPVYENSIDNIIGVIYLNHYYKTLSENPEMTNDGMRQLLIKPCFLHKTMKLPAAMNILRERKTHLAVVIDEYGGTMGIVTMEDILEELVGEIWDESDEIVNEITQTGEYTYDVSGDMNIDDFFSEIDFECPNDFECEYSTVGGWAVEMLQADPHIGDSFNYENLCIVVTEMDDMRITKLTVLVNPVEDEATEE